MTSAGATDRVVGIQRRNWFVEQVARIAFERPTAAPARWRYRQVRVAAGGSPLVPMAGVRTQP